MAIVGRRRPASMVNDTPRNPSVRVPRVAKHAILPPASRSPAVPITTILIFVSGFPIPPPRVKRRSGRIFAPPQLESYVCQNTLLQGSNFEKHPTNPSATMRSFYSFVDRLANFFSFEVNNMVRNWDGSQWMVFALCFFVFAFFCVNKDAGRKRI